MGGGMSETKSIAVVGCGALGSALGGLLAAAGHAVLAVCRSREQAEALNERGLLLREEGKELRLPLRACTELPGGETYDLVLLLVKSYDTPAAVAGLAGRVGPRTPVLTLQNGLGNAEVLAAHLKPEQVLVGTTTFGAQRESWGAVRLSGRGACEIGAWSRAAESHLQPAARLLSSAGIPCSVSGNIIAALWKKLAVSAVINPLTALLRICNGELLEHRDLEPLFAVVVEEVWQVAARHKIALSLPLELVAEVRRVCQVTAANRSSMLRDVEQGHRAEVDAINGAVVRLGYERGVLTPANLTLTSLIRSLSQHEGK